MNKMKKIEAKIIQLLKKRLRYENRVVAIIRQQNGVDGTMMSLDKNLYPSDFIDKSDINSCR